MELGPGNRRFRCRECRKTDDVEEAFAAKVFIATELLGLDVDRGALLLVGDPAEARRMASLVGLWSYRSIANSLPAS